MRAAVIASLLSVSLLRCSTSAFSAQSPVFYQIFVRSFQDSNGDGVGDLRGVTSRLDYLADLGVTGIWLMPIFPSASYHGYDVTDYRAVRPDFGTLHDLDDLIAAAHSRGIQVVLDLVLNHASVRHPWFTEHPERFVWRSEDPGWPGVSHWFRRGERLYYAFFSPFLPDLDLTRDDVKSDLRDAARFWLERGIDGFRLDAVRYFVEGPQGEPDTPQTHAWLQEWVGQLRREYPGRLWIGEAWAELPAILPYIRMGDELDLAFHFSAAGGLVEALKTSNPDPWLSAWRQTLDLRAPLPRLAPFVTNHDMKRVASQVPGDETTRLRKLKLAAAALLGSPGVPFIYYGEEIGMTNGDFLGRTDLGQRTPMPWDNSPGRGFTEGRPWAPFANQDPRQSVESQAGDPDSLLETYRTLLRLRPEGTMRLLAQVGLPGEGVFAWVRGEGTGRVWIVMRLGAGAPVDLDLSLDGPISPGGPRLLWGKVRVARVKNRRGRWILRIRGLAPDSGAWISG